MIKGTRKNRFAVYACVAALFAAASISLNSCGRGSSSGSNSAAVNVNKFDHPTDITASPDGTKLFVVNNVRSSVSVFQPGSLSIIVDIPVSCAPRHLAVSSDSRYLFVSHDATTNCKLSPLGPSSGDSYEGGVWNGYSGTRLSRIDLDTYSVTNEININEPTDRGLTAGRELVWDYDNDQLYVAFYTAGGLGVFDTATNSFQSQSPFGLIPQAISVALTHDSSTAIVPDTTTGNNKVYAINTSNNTNYAGSPWATSTFSKPSYVLMAPTSSYFFLSSNNNYRIFAIDSSSPADGWDDDRIVGILAFLKSTLKPTVMAMTPDEKYLLAVLSKGTGQPAYLYVVPWADLLAGVGSGATPVYQLGSAPSDIAIIGDYVYVTDQITSSIFVYNFKTTAGAYDTQYFVNPSGDDSNVVFYENDNRL